LELFIFLIILQFTDNTFTNSLKIDKFDPIFSLRRMKTTVLIALTLLSLQCVSQNLVRNCEFTLHEGCPSSHGQFDNALHWFTPGEGTTDFCHTCGASNVNVPNNQWGSQEAYNGEGYGHIICYYPFQGSDYREYMSTDLGCNLIAGERYIVSFYVSCADRAKYAIDRIGLHFSEDMILQEGEGLIQIGGEPHIQNTPGDIVQSKLQWTRISGIYTADGTERYLTIGNFFRDTETEVYEFPNLTTRYGSYYVDQVEVIPETPLLMALNDTVLCPQETLEVDVTMPCAISYSWNDGASNPARTITESGFYSVSVEIGCGTVTGGFNVSFHPEPDLNLPADTFFCTGNSVILQPDEGFSNYLWEDGSTTSERLVSQTGLYWLEVTTENNCLFRDTIVVESLSAPTVAFGADTVICIGDSLVLFAGPVTGHTIYLWNDSSKGNTLTLGEKGNYWVHMSNPCGETSDTIVVDTRNCEPLIWAPNAFTPNGDGMNDSFKVKGQNIDDFFLAIYNRWGEIVFETKEMDMAWDGRHNNNLCPAEIYIWIIRYSSYSSEYPVSETLKGTVLLYR